MLDIRSAYMLRDDGVVLNSGARHPYILCHHDDKIEENLKALFIYNKNWYIWLYENTRHEETKKKLKNVITLFVHTIMTANEPVFGISIDDVDYLVDYFGIEKITVKDVSIDYPESSLKKLFILKSFLKKLFMEVNFVVNQEFLRFRLSGPIAYIGNYSDIYFRVSSFDFDWFPYIWNVVNENRNMIDTVTIMYDKQSGKVEGSSDKYYALGGKLIKKLPTDEFLTLKGNPIVEEKSIFDDFENNDVTFNIGSWFVKRKEYILENFK